jgi:hypothetical protein
MEQGEGWLMLRIAAALVAVSIASGCTVRSGAQHSLKASREDPVVVPMTSTPVATDPAKLDSLPLSADGVPPTMTERVLLGSVGNTPIELRRDPTFVRNSGYCIAFIDKYPKGSLGCLGENMAPDGTPDPMRLVASGVVDGRLIVVYETTGKAASIRISGQPRVAKPAQANSTRSVVAIDATDLADGLKVTVIDADGAEVDSLLVDLAMPRRVEAEAAKARAAMSSSKP